MVLGNEQLGLSGGTSNREAAFLPGCTAPTKEGSDRWSPSGLLGAARKFRAGSFLRDNEYITWFQKPPGQWFQGERLFRLNWDLDSLLARLCLFLHISLVAGQGQAGRPKHWEAKQGFRHVQVLAPYAIVRLPRLVDKNGDMRADESERASRMGSSGTLVRIPRPLRLGTRDLVLDFISFSLYA